MILSSFREQKEKLHPHSRTTIPSSVMGSILRSFGYTDDGTIIQICPGNYQRDALTTKVRTASQSLKHLRPLCSNFSATAAAYADDDIPEEYPDWPGSLISARAILLAAARDEEEAIDVYQDMKDVCPENWAEDPQRRFLLDTFRHPLLRGHPLIDHPSIEGAFCQLATSENITSRRRNQGKETMQRLVNGQEEWSEDLIDEVLIPKIRAASLWLRNAIPPEDGEVTDKHRQAIRNMSPAQTGTVWQLWPEHRFMIQAESPWISMVLLDPSPQDVPEA